MKIAMTFLSAAALLMTVVPPLLFVSGRVSEEMLKSLMLAGALLWFPSAIGRDWLMHRKG